MISDFVRKRVGALSTDIVKHFEEAGHSSAMIRQRIRRTQDLQVIASLTFPHKGKFYYHQSDWGKPKYWESLLTAFRTSNSSYGTAVDGIDAKGGVIPLSLFSIVSGSPVKQSRHVASEVVLERLLSAKVLSIEDDPVFGSLLVLNPHVSTSAASPNPHVYQHVENIMALAVKDWCKNLGLASYNTIQVRDGTKQNQPTYGTTNWDIVSPSYLYPLRNGPGGSSSPHGFFVCDLFVNDIKSVHQVKYYIKKLAALKSIKGFYPVIPMIVANHYEANAYKELRALGIIAATPESLFGKNVADAFLSLLHTLNNAALVATNNPDQILNLLTKLGSIEGAAKNLRGDLFELIVGNLVHSREGYSIDIRVKVRDYETNKSKEIDVRGVKGKEVVWNCECKAHQPSQRVTLENVRKWIEEDVPFIFKTTLKNRPDLAGHRFVFEYWTCGTFDSDAEKFLNDKMTSITKFDINWRDGKSVREYAQQSKVQSMIRSLDEHYFSHPLASGLATSSQLV